MVAPPSPAKVATATPFVPQRRPQYLASAAVAIGSFALGTVVAWSSPALPKLVLTPEFINLTTAQKSWLAAFVPLGAMFGGPLGGYGIERYGRQRTLLMSTLPFAIGWIMVAMAHSLMMMYFGRFLTGVCCGVFTLCSPIYLSEITEPRIRGQSNSFSAVACALALLLTNLIGAFISWQTLTILSATVPVMYASSLFYLPESPVYLLGKGKKKRSTHALMWFRGAAHKEQVEGELGEIRDAQAALALRTLKLSEYFAPDVLKSTGVCMVLMLLQQLCGINAIVFYSTTIFQSAGTAMSPFLSSIIVGLVFLGGVLLFSFLVEKLGRRLLLLLSGTLIAISLLCIGYFFYAKAARDPIVDYIAWLPLMSLVTFAIAFNLGLGPLPWLLMAELIPPHVKGSTACVATVFNWSLAFLVTKSFEDLNELLGAHGAYWMFAGVSAFGVLFTYMYVPETKGKKLEEIQEHFRSGGKVKKEAAAPVAASAV